MDDIPHAPMPKTEARLSIDGQGGRLRYQGIVADQTTRSAIATALDRASEGHASGTLSVDPDTRAVEWAPNLEALSSALLRSGGQLNFRGRQIELVGPALDQEARADLLRAARRLYPEHALVGAFRGVDMRQALPEAGDLDGLIPFLNALPVEFREGSALLVPVSAQALARGARGIQAVHPRTRILLRVHPEAGPDASTAEDVARQRAEAISTQLALRGVAPDRIDVHIASPDPEMAGKIEFALPDAAPAASPSEPALRNQ